MKSREVMGGVGDEDKEGTRPVWRSLGFSETFCRPWFRKLVPLRRTGLGEKDERWSSARLRVQGRESHREEIQLLP